LPKEYRFVIFTPAEAAAALENYARYTKRALPPGRIESAEPIGDESPVGRLYLAVPDGPPTIVSFTNEDVCQALIGACILGGIPLPRDVPKHAERLRGRFALRIGGEAVAIEEAPNRLRSGRPR